MPHVLPGYRAARPSYRGTTRRDTYTTGIAPYNRIAARGYNDNLQIRLDRRHDQVYCLAVAETAGEFSNGAI